MGIFNKKTENKNSIDTKLARIEALKVERQKVEDFKDEENGKLEAIISKHDVVTKALRDKTFRNNDICTNRQAEIDREIERLLGEIRIEDEINHKRTETLLKKAPEKSSISKICHK